MALSFHGTAIHASIDGTTVADLQDQTHTHGMFGIGSGWDHTAFDNLAVYKAEQ